MKYEFDYTVYNSISELDKKDQELVNQAYMATTRSYAPYSNFKVGAAAITNKGNLITGSNQENSSYTATICAERVLLSALSTQGADEFIVTLAISYVDHNGVSNQPITPCGVCRQAIFEHENRFKQNVRIILACQDGPIYIINKGRDLLPLPFSLQA